MEQNLPLDDVGLNILDTDKVVNEINTVDMNFYYFVLQRLCFVL